MSTIAHSTAYFDETSVDESHKFSVVAGFFGTRQMWTLFERKWRGVAIPDAEVKKYFRHRPSSNNRPEDEKRYRDALTLAEVMRNYTFWSVYVTLDREMFQPLFDALAKHKSRAPLLSSAYTICSFACCELLDQLAEHNQLGKDESPIQVVFDKGNENERWLEKGYGAYYKTQGKSFLSKNPAFLNDDGVIPLKAADAYAWLLARKYNRGEELEALKTIHKSDGMLVVEKRELTGEEGKRILEKINKVIKTPV